MSYVTVLVFAFCKAENGSYLLHHFRGNCKACTVKTLITIIDVSDIYYHSIVGSNCCVTELNCDVFVDILII